MPITYEVIWIKIISLEFNLHAITANLKIISICFYGVFSAIFLCCTVCRWTISKRPAADNTVCNKTI